VKAQLRYEWGLTVPDTTAIGDKFTLTADVTVTEMRLELVDVSTHSGEEQHLNGESEATITLTNIRLEEQTPA
jgi:hypothetical protein